MKKIVALILVLGASCSVLNPTVSFENALARATAERWSSGAEGGGIGATFRLNFYKLEEELNCDTLWVNSIPLQTERTTVGDTTYVSAFYFTEKVEEKTLANAADYSGKLRLLVKDKTHYINIERFEIVHTEPRP
jgi:hypothetical protein